MRYWLWVLTGAALGWVAADHGFAALMFGGLFGLMERSLE